MPRRKHRHTAYYGGGKGAFTPVSVSGLTAWYDFSDASTLYTDTGRTTLVASDGDAIGGVTDKLGANHLTRGGAAGTEGTYKVNIANSKSACLLDGSADFLETTGAALTAMLSGSDPAWSVFVVARPSGSGAAQIWAPWGAGNSGDGNPFYRGRWTGNYNMTKRDDAAVLVNVAAADDPGAATVIVSHVSPGTTAGVWDNGVAVIAAGSALDVGATTINQVELGATKLAGSPNSFFSGHIMEALFYNVAVSTASHNLIGNGLATKWGLTWTTVS